MTETSNFAHDQAEIGDKMDELTELLHIFADKYSLIPLISNARTHSGDPLPELNLTGYQCD